MRSSSESPAPRSDCLTCRRPPGLCVCDVVQRVDNRTGVTIVQHPRERDHPFGTARLARSGLCHAQVHVIRPEPDGRMRVELAVPPGTALLYPSPHAHDLADPGPEGPPSHLLVIDATWSLAQQVYRDNPWMAELRHVRVEPERPSAYRIRLEPAPHCLSTIESIAAALSILEPETAHLDRLLDGFTALVDRQLHHVDTLGGLRHRHRVRSRAPVLELLAREWSRVVIARGATTRAGALRAWAAVRPSTGAVFEGAVDSLPEFVDRWSSFCGPDDLVATWNEDDSRVFEAVTGLEPHFLQLKSTWCNFDRRASGTLGDLVRRLGLPQRPVPVGAWAAVHLSEAVALAEHLRTLHRPRLPG